MRPCMHDERTASERLLRMCMRKSPVNGSTAARDRGLASDKVCPQISSTAASAIILVVHCRTMVSMTFDLMMYLLQPRISTI